MAAIELRIGAFDEGDSGSFDNNFQVFRTMRVKALNGLRDALAAFQFLAIEDPDLNSSNNIGIILQMVHFSNRFETDPVKTAFNDD